MISVKYGIDSRLKQGVDYPEDLARLVALFNGDQRPWLGIGRQGEKRFKDEIGLTESTFREFFLSGSPGNKMKTIKRVNKNLENFRPMIYSRTEGGKQEFYLAHASNLAEKQNCGIARHYWMWLAHAGVSPTGSGGRRGTDSAKCRP
jgi:hypothetical protein